MILDIHALREQNRVIPPNDPLGANPVGQPPERLNHGLLLREPLLQLPVVWSDRKLEIVHVVRKFTQTRQHRRRILAPKDNAINHIRRKPDFADLVPIHRIPDAHIPLPDSVAKPVRIEGGNIGSSANAQYHRESVYHFAALCRRHPRLRRISAQPVYLRSGSASAAGRSFQSHHLHFAGSGFSVLTK